MDRSGFSRFFWFMLAPVLVAASLVWGAHAGTSGKDVSSYLSHVDSVVSRGPFSATWDSLAGYEVP